MLIFTTKHRKLFCVCIYLLTANSKCSDYQRQQAEYQAAHQAAPSTTQSQIVCRRSSISANTNSPLISFDLLYRETVLQILKTTLHFDLLFITLFWNFCKVDIVIQNEIWDMKSRLKQSTPFTFQRYLPFLPCIYPLARLPSEILSRIQLQY